jgi:hypothetical protein
MKKLIASLMAVTMLTSANPAPCTDHVVSRQLMGLRLAEASQQRAMDITTLRSFLSEPMARRAAAAVHLESDSVAARLSALTDRELRDLADRASRLQVDPHSGRSRAANAVLITLAVVGALFIILAIAIATSDSGPYY